MGWGILRSRPLHAQSRSPSWSKARELAQQTRSEVVAVLIAPGREATIGELTAYGADRVLVLENSQLGPVFGMNVANSFAGAFSMENPYAVLFAATADGRDLASRLAARFELGLTGDAMDLEIDSDGRLVQLKPALGGNVVAPILSRTDRKSTRLNSSHW